MMKRSDSGDPQAFRFHNDRGRAFTLVELLIVIAIVALLLSILVVSMRGAKAMGKRIQCSVRLNGLGKAFSMYLTEYDPLMPELEDFPYQAIQHYSTYKRNQYPSFVASRGNTFWCGLGCLWARGLVDNAMSFYCPATEGWKDEYDSAIDSNRKWGKTNGNGFLKVNSGYVYWPLSKETYTQDEWNKLNADQNQDAVNYLIGYPKSPDKQPDLNRGKALIADYTFHDVKGSGWNLNALFPDGHVVFQTQPKDTDGLAMFHTSGQFGTMPGGTAKSVCVTKFMNALQP
jgi:prepilin-type N-terminal cleavage/methylation domain-containing protein